MEFIDLIDSRDGSFVARELVMQFHIVDNRQGTLSNGHIVIIVTEGNVRRQFDTW